jgi:hypothetical protein
MMERGVERGRRREGWRERKRVREGVKGERGRDRVINWEEWSGGSDNAREDSYITEIEGRRRGEESRGANELFTWK